MKMIHNGRSCWRPATEMLANGPARQTLDPSMDHPPRLENGWMNDLNNSRSMVWWKEQLKRH